MFLLIIRLKTPYNPKPKSRKPSLRTVLEPERKSYLRWLHRWAHAYSARTSTSGQCCLNLSNITRPTTNKNGNTHSQHVFCPSLCGAPAKNLLGSTRQTVWCKMDALRSTPAHGAQISIALWFPCWDAPEKELSPSSSRISPGQGHDTPDTPLQHTLAPPQTKPELQSKLS